MRKDLAVFLFALLLCLRAFAQTTGAIEGVITDSTGSAVPAAAVKLTNTGTGVVTSTTPNSSGFFLADGLAVGVYDLEIAHPGFTTSGVKGLVVDVTARVHREVTLEVGNVQESVTVQATSVQVETANGTVSGVVTREQIETAVLNGRHYARLAMLLPGATYHSGNDELANAGLNAPDSPVSINGINNKASGWFVDGAYDVNFGNGSANTHAPVIDSLEEVQVQTANYSARYGTTGGAVINA